MHESQGIMIFKFVLAITCIYAIFPVHELGHLITATYYDVNITHVQIFPTWANISPQITVNEFSFPSALSLLVYYLSGVALPVLLAGIYAAIKRPTRRPSIVYVWFTLAPVSALTDFSNLFRVFGLSEYTKWIHFILGMYLMFRIEHYSEIQ